MARLSRQGRKIKDLEEKLAKSDEAVALHRRVAEIAGVLNANLNGRLVAAVGLIRMAADQFEARGVPPSAAYLRAEAGKLDPAPRSEGAALDPDLRQPPGSGLAGVLRIARERSR